MADWSAWFRLTIGILATWRVTHLIAREDGPWDAKSHLLTILGAADLRVGRSSERRDRMQLHGWFPVPKP